MLRPWRKKPRRKVSRFWVGGIFPECRTYRFSQLGTVLLSWVGLRPWSEGLSQKNPMFSRGFFFGLPKQTKELSTLFYFCRKSHNIRQKVVTNVLKLAELDTTQENERLEPKNHPFAMENHLPNLYHCVPAVNFPWKSNRNPVVHLECRNSEISHVFFCFVGVSVYSSFMGVLRGA